MCVEDYEFRHYSARRGKECRKFTIVNQEEFARNYYVNISQFEEYGEVGLCKILIYLSTKGLPIENKKFYLPKFQAIIQPFSFCKIVFDSLNDREILLKAYPLQKPNEDIFMEDMQRKFQQEANADQNYYCRLENLEEEELAEAIQSLNTSESNSSVEVMEEEKPQSNMVEQIEEKTPVQFDKHSSENKQKGKVKKEGERGIKEVIRAVKAWRVLFEEKNYSLPQAANLLGISKKSLDDYYLVLRTGQILGFEFAANLEKKMGHLRNFIRVKTKDQKVKGRLGKAVKCFELVEEVDIDKLVNSPHSIFIH